MDLNGLNSSQKERQVSQAPHQRTSLGAPRWEEHLLYSCQVARQHHQRLICSTKTPMTACKWASRPKGGRPMGAKHWDIRFGPSCVEHRSVRARKA